MNECKNRDTRPLEWKDGDGERDRFEKWLKKEVDLVTLSDKSAAHRGYQYRQPEIDALKSERDILKSVVRSTAGTLAEIDKALGIGGSLGGFPDVTLDAIDALKAENERLRNYAERYQYLRHRVRGELDRFIEQKTFRLLINPVGDVMKGSVAQHLDEAIDAAMTAPDTKGE